MNIVTLELHNLYKSDRNFVVFLNIHFYFERKIKSSSQAAAATATFRTALLSRTTAEETA